MQRKSNHSCLVALLALSGSALTGCPGDSSDGGAMQASDAGPDDTRGKCPDEVPDLTVGASNGLTAMGKHMAIQARVIAADHVPPQRFYNTWTVQFLDADGKELDDVTIDRVCAYMPVHGHGKPPTAIEPGDNPSEFVLKQLNLSMPGPWLVQLAVTSKSITTGATEYVSDKCDANRSHPGSEYIEFSVCQPNP